MLSITIKFFFFRYAFGVLALLASFKVSLAHLCCNKNSYPLKFILSL